ncbi:MAG: GntR family transcriptional regulator [Synergistaceae bacterium]|jgi:DNA-binding GntR family transcriptional regulator|nr:GntR family transcriptional regulator [Synergistaceae bacterium]
MSDLQAITPVQSISDVVYEKLKTAVMSDVFKRGERLVEHEIAEKLNVSRTPVRAALLRLESEGILEARPNHGLVVKEYSIEDIREIYLIREALESLAAKYGAQNATGDDIDNIRAMFDEMDKVYRDPQVSPDYIFELHRKFSEAYHNTSHMPTLVRMIESLREQMFRFRRVSLSGSERKIDALNEHRRMFEAIEKRDSELAAELTRVHIRNALNAYLSSVK